MRKHSIGCVVAAAVWLALGCIGTAVESPDLRGPFLVEEYQTSLRDDVRNRSMDLQLFLPVSLGEPIARPLIIFNHGFLLSASGYRSYGEHLASHGFVVALPSFPASLLSVHHAKLAEDVRFVIDMLLTATGDESHPLFGRIDPQRIGASGHSLGGKLSLLEAVSDERIDAIAVLDPVDAGNPLWDDPVRYPSVAPELMPEITVPLLFVGAELGSKLILLSPCAPGDENYQRFYEAANAPAIEITQLDVGHSQYVDEGVADEINPCPRGDVDSEWVRSSSRTYITAFFLGWLAEDREALDWLDDRLEEDTLLGHIEVRQK